MVENRKTQPVPKIYPFNRETIRTITGDPMASISRATLSVCDICSKIPESLSAAEQGGLLEATARLAVRAEVRAGLALLRCPLCACLYKLERRSEFLAAGGQEDEVLVRLQAGDAFELLLGQEAKYIVRQGDRWSLKW